MQPVTWDDFLYHFATTNALMEIPVVPKEAFGSNVLETND